MLPKIGDFEFSRILHGTESDSQTVWTCIYTTTVVPRSALPIFKS